MAANNAAEKLRDLGERLRDLPAPTLVLTKKSLAVPTSEQVAWAILVYGHGILYQTRALVGGVVRAGDDENWPAAIPLARTLLECGASAYYVEKHVTQYLRPQQDLEAAWKLLSRAVTGNRYRKEYMQESESGGPKYDPLHIAKQVRALNEFASWGDAEREYSFLSEYTHPNMAALSQHYELTLVDGEQRAVFSEAPRKDIEPALAATIGVVAVITSVHRLVGWCDDPEAQALGAYIKKVMAEPQEK